MNTTTLLLRPAVPLSAIAAQSDRNQAAARQATVRADMARSFAERGPVPTAAAAVSERYGRLASRMRDMLERADSSHGNDREAELCGDLEDLERLVGEVLRGAA
jgi:sugar/nucleoside kinase (ribokinase family)